MRRHETGDDRSAEEQAAEERAAAAADRRHRRMFGVPEADTHDDDCTCDGCYDNMRLMYEY